MPNNASAIEKIKKYLPTKVYSTSELALTLVQTLNSLY
ncbi:Uncharacterised protein [Streptococcus pyogenes]|nr:hypothetical protein DP15_723 [Streptococcus pyogenes]SQF13158.1 Uncharacterised protein [Streptococcus pyogenes]SQF21969.1 Uncharacterised protein [Streptococcus pyogenes]VGV56711.1 Uncharacterised protein [Streptococcus pyogenes]VGV82549.1 Uncharacterised protein [Streptococcus pyogenes]